MVGKAHPGDTWRGDAGMALKTKLDPVFYSVKVFLDWLELNDVSVVEAARRGCQGVYIARRNRGTIPEEQAQQWADSLDVELADIWDGDKSRGKVYVAKAVRLRNVPEVPPEAAPNKTPAKRACRAFLRRTRRRQNARCRAFLRRTRRRQNARCRAFLRRTSMRRPSHLSRPTKRPRPCCQAWCLARSVPFPRSVDGPRNHIRLGHKLNPDEIRASPTTRQPARSRLRLTRQPQWQRCRPA